ncbi:discoidin domain-containing protein [Actinokineospora guangxiensis]|uniref:Discoidin domain-containing protein n=1 Tax=Actinokineospora guangxiensis TaxID=1490288 RepID=A0ABW0EUR5_9PSEU
MPAGRLSCCLAAAALTGAPTAPTASPAAAPTSSAVSAELVDLWAAHRSGSAEVARLAARADQVVRTGLGEHAEPVRAALRLLSEDPARAWSARLALLDAELPAAQRPFVDAAVRDYDTAYAAPATTAITTLGVHAGHGLDRMTDGDPATYYWSARPAGAGAAVTVDLGAPRRVLGVRVRLGKPDRPDDVVRRGAVEFSPDGARWHSVGGLSGAEHTIRVSAETRYVRLRSTADQPNWLVVRELSADLGPTERAADGDPASVFTITGRAVELPLGQASSVVIRAAADTPSGVEVQVRTEDGHWSVLGRTAGAYTELPLPSARTTRLRIVRGGGVPPVVVHEVTARRAR